MGPGRHRAARSRCGCRCTRSRWRCCARPARWRCPRPTSSASRRRSPPSEARDQLGYSVRRLPGGRAVPRPGAEHDRRPDRRGAAGAAGRRDRRWSSCARWCRTSSTDAGEPECRRSPSCTSAWATSAARRWPSGCWRSPSASGWPARRRPGRLGRAAAQPQRRHRRLARGRGDEPAGGPAGARAAAATSTVSPRASCGPTMIDAADLVLTATADQQEYVVALRPDAAGAHLRAGRVRPAARRGGRRRPAAGRGRPRTPCTRAGWPWWRRSTRPGRAAPPLPTDDLDDPWGRGDQCFSRVADEIEETVPPARRALLLLPCLALPAAWLAPDPACPAGVSCRRTRALRFWGKTEFGRFCGSF